MKKIICTGLIVCMSMLSGCLATAPVSQQTRIDENADVWWHRSNGNSGVESCGCKPTGASPRQIQFARENAAVTWVNRGFRVEQEGQLGMAMRRFNQAWLLNPKHPEVYAGFASVQHDQGKTVKR